MLKPVYERETMTRNHGTAGDDDSHGRVSVSLGNSLIPTLLPRCKFFTRPLSLLNYPVLIANPV